MTTTVTERKMTLDRIKSGRQVKPDRIVLAGTEGVGKCFGPRTMVLMFDGSVRAICDVEPGELLLGPDSRPRTVLEKHNGEGRMFSVRPNKGEAFLCNEHHELVYMHSSKKEWHTITPVDWMNSTPNQKKEMMLVSAAVDYPEREIPYDAYFLGVWLGDGTERSRTVQITNPDPEIVEYLQGFAHQQRLIFAQRNPLRVELVGYRRGDSFRTNHLCQYLRVIGKSIPDVYRINSRRVRLELLAGLLDTDGYLSNNCFEITQVRHNLAEQIIALAQSLGFQATARIKLVNDVQYIRIFISGDTDQIPTRVARKRAESREQVKNPMHVGFDIEEVEQGEYIGLEVDGDHLFLLADCRIVHNSTFAAGAPDAIFIAAEDGIAHLDVASFPEPSSLDEVHEAIRTLRQEQHTYRTLVIDTIDWVEPMIIHEVCQRNGWKHIEEPGYGKGYVVALDEWRKLIADLDSLRAERGMEIILIAHTQIKIFSNPAGPDYSRFELNVNRQAAALVKQWADSVLFACYEEQVRKEKGEMKAKGVSTGHRVIHTVRTSAWDAKNRHYLPDVLPLDYGEYAAARAAEQPDTLDALTTELDSLLAELKPDKKMQAKIAAFVGDRTDARKLAQTNDRLRAILSEKESA